MRISTGHMFDTYQSNITKSQNEYFRIQQQISTGKKFASGSEDPLASSLSLCVRSLQSRFMQFDKNLRSATDYAGNSEIAIGEIGNLLRNATSLAIQGASDALDAPARQAIADSVSRLQDRLVSLANTQGSSSQYIFAGHKTTTKPFVVNAGTLNFNGDTNAIQVEIRSSEYLPANVANASTLITDIYNELETLKSNLINGSVSQLSDQSIANLRNLQDQTHGVRAELGARLQQIETFKAENQRRIDDFTKDISDLEDVDLTEAFVKYQQADSAYRAALQVASKGMQLSLMDYLR